MIQDSLHNLVDLEKVSSLGSDWSMLYERNWLKDTVWRGCCAYTPHTYTHTYKHAHTCTRICTHTHKHTDAHRHSRTHKHVHTRARTHAHIHSYVHTHTQLVVDCDMLQKSNLFKQVTKLPPK